jgi:arginase
MAAQNSPSSPARAAGINLISQRFLDVDAPKHIPPQKSATEGSQDAKSNQFREEIASFLLTAPYTVSVFGAGFQGGQPIGGVETAPKAIRDAGLSDTLYKLGWEVVDKGNVDMDGELNDENDPPMASVNAPIRVTGGCFQTFQAAAQAAAMGHLALTLGGDHSAAIGSIAGVASRYPNVGVIWVDAHADLNTPMISPSGNLHGMPVGFLLGLVEGKVPGLEWFQPCITPDRIVYVGLRDVDFVEKKLLRRLGIKAYSMHEIDEFGIGKVMKMALDHISPLRHRPLHLSFDVDSIDPTIVPSTGTPVLGGLTFREAAYVCEAVAETGLLVGLDIVEVNPDLGTDEEKNQTVDVALKLIRSALGHQLI